MTKKVPVYYKDKQIGYINLNNKREQIIHLYKNNKSAEDILDILRDKENISMDCKIERDKQ